MSLTSHTSVLSKSGGKQLSLMALLRRAFGLRGMRRSRQRLAKLDDHLLRDIGISRAEANAEAALKAWDAPDHWHR